LSRCILAERGHRAAALFSLLSILRPLRSTLFPYTTLFRSGGVLEIKSLAVDPSYRRRGAGRMLIDFVKEEYRGRFRQLLVGTGGSEEHTSELQSRFDLVCRLLLEKQKKT